MNNFACWFLCKIKCLIFASERSSDWGNYTADGWVMLILIRRGCALKSSGILYRKCIPQVGWCIASTDDYRNYWWCPCAGTNHEKGNCALAVWLFCLWRRCVFSNLKSTEITLSTVRSADLPWRSSPQRGEYRHYRHGMVFDPKPKICLHLLWSFANIVSGLHAMFS